MALADICGFDKYMKPNATTVDALGDEMFSQCSNLADNYELAMPPFTNVTIPFNCINSIIHSIKFQIILICIISRCFTSEYSQPKISTH